MNNEYTKRKSVIDILPTDIRQKCMNIHEYASLTQKIWDQHPMRMWNINTLYSLRVVDEFPDVVTAITTMIGLLDPLLVDTTYTIVKRDQSIIVEMLVNGVSAKMAFDDIESGHKLTRFEMMMDKSVSTQEIVINAISENDLDNRVVHRCVGRKFDISDILDIRVVMDAIRDRWKFYGQYMRECRWNPPAWLTPKRIIHTNVRQCRANAELTLVVATSTRKPIIDELLTGGYGNECKEKKETGEESKTEEK